MLVMMLCFVFLQPNPRDYMDDYHVSGVFYLIHEKYLIAVKMVKTYMCLIFV